MTILMVFHVSRFTTGEQLRLGLLLSLCEALRRRMRTIERARIVLLIEPPLVAMLLQVFDGPASNFPSIVLGQPLQRPRTSIG